MRKKWQRSCLLVIVISIICLTLFFLTQHKSHTNSSLLPPKQPIPLKNNNLAPLNTNLSGSSNTTSPADSAVATPSPSLPASPDKVTPASPTAANDLLKGTVRQTAFVFAGHRKLQLQLVSSAKKEQSTFDIGQIQLIVKNGHKIIQKSTILNAPIAEFKIYHMRGLPNPLILVATLDSRGAAQTIYTLYPYTLNMHQKLRALTLKNETWQTSNYGGVYVGKLQGNKQFGAIVWERMGDLNTSGKISYKIKRYHWNGKYFILTKTLITKQKYDNSNSALLDYGFVVKDIAKTFKIIQENS